jgi:hypothetical protein
MRKKLIAISLAAVALGGIARAEVVAQAIPAEAIMQYGNLAILLIQAQFPNPPVKVDPSPEHCTGYHVDQKIAVVAMPDRNLTQKILDELADKEIPAGVLATKSLSIIDKDAIINGERLAVANVNDQLKLPLFFLAVKAKGAERTLEVYSKDGKAIVSAPLKKQEGKSEQLIGVKLSNIDLEAKKLDVTVSLAGYDGTLKFGHLDP